MKGAEALRTACNLVRSHGLPMKVVSLDFDPKGGRALLCFFSEERVDFRALLKELTSALRTRIEMRQIGARDAAKQVGGLGPCGRELCCSSFLPEFTPVSIRMAKDQGLALNPAKLSGMCGRLMCCLAYEHDTYAEAQKGLPKVGKNVITPKGRGRVISQEILPRTVRVALTDGTVESYPADQVERANPPQPQAPPQPPKPGKRRK